MTRFGRITVVRAGTGMAEKTVLIARLEAYTVKVQEPCAPGSCTVRR